MEFCTFHHVYQVLHCGRSKENMQVYLCRKDSDGQLYQLFEMEKKFLRASTIVFLNQELQNKTFVDFHDLFLHEEHLYAVMAYHGETPLLTKLQEEELEFEERLAIGQNLLEAFLLTGMSPYFCYQCLRMEQIQVKQDLSITFSYELDDAEAAPGIRQQHVWNAFASLLKEMWKKELYNHNVKEMETFIDGLFQDEEKTLEEVYKSYLLMGKKIANIERDKRKRSRRKPFRIWDQVKKGIPLVKKLIAILFLLALAGYAGYTIWQATLPSGKSQNVIRYIGTLQLKEKE